MGREEGIIVLFVALRRRTLILWLPFEHGEAGVVWKKESRRVERSTVRLKDALFISHSHTHSRLMYLNGIGFEMMRRC